jgi:hypothetical protein
MLLLLQWTLIVNIVSCTVKVITESTTEWKHLGRFVWSHRRSLHDDRMSDLCLSLLSGVAIAPGKYLCYLAKQTRDYKFERLAIVSAPKENPHKESTPIQLHLPSWIHIR